MENISTVNNQLEIISIADACMSACYIGTLVEHLGNRGSG